MSPTLDEKVLFLIRHGEADYNLLDQVNCHPEVQNNLTRTGREQAARCAQAIDEPQIDLIYCSAFPRARQTAEIINQRFQAPLLVEPLLNETGAFAFEGRPAAHWHAAQIPDRFTAQIPGCESYTEMKARLARFLDTIQTVPHSRLLVVSHEEPLQILMGLLENLTDAAARTRPVSHCLPRRYTLPVC